MSGTRLPQILETGALTATVLEKVGESACSFARLLMRAA